MVVVAMTARRIFITGAAGFTGLHACRKFAASGWEVVAALSPRGANTSGLEAALTERCELTDAEAVAEMMKRLEPDAVLHLAGRNAVDVSWTSPASTLAANLMSTAYLLEGARAIGGCRVLVAGSMLRASEAALSEAPHPYGFSKTLQTAAAKAWHRWYGLPVMIAEPSNLIGPGNSAGLCGKIVRWAVSAEQPEGKTKAPPFRLSSLHESRDFMDVRDAVAAYELVLNEGEPGRSYAIESGRFRTLAEVKSAFDDLAQAELPWEIGEGTAALAPTPQPRDCSPILELGWKPVLTFRQSIFDALQDERERRSRERGDAPFDSP
ncbi:GDP-4-dehydro-6-deoxy-D-mannose reductase [Cohnella sp. SGD-V74]|uniref:NAD-dependent epimerase/dehydratase family protein n=1 Tax=unclassified Cohnella TaxID=2636738 RepID=UPI000B8BD85E|nr:MULTISPECIES: NAD-dependent epimerase/dehydratase family protein [unclassified Cohnella]PRX60968.1 GDP-4-dehydro-6-deoxy-D-mannose reductase [Cohnella sp. SGD-V74]